MFLDNVDTSRSVATHGALLPSYIVLHNTMGGSATGSINFLNNETNGFGYHIVIDRDGTIYQTAPLNEVTWHAGLSNWRGWDNLNSFSVGISFANYGPLTWKNSRWENAYGGGMDSADVLPGPVPHYNGASQYETSGWETYTEAQVEAGLNVCRAIMEVFPMRDIIRHDDVAIGRKIDTGPALDLAPFTELAGDRSAEKINMYRVVTPDETLTIRDSYSHHGDEIGEYADGTEIYVLSKAYFYRNGNAFQSKWWLVSTDGFERTGFVNSDFLEFAEPFA